MYFKDNYSNINFNDNNVNCTDCNANRNDCSVNCTDCRANYNDFNANAMIVMQTIMNVV